MAERERESYSCTEKGRDVVVAVSLCKPQRNEEHTINSKSDFNIYSPTKPKPIEFRTYSAEAACCFSCHLKRVLLFSPMSSQFNRSVWKENSADLKVGLCFCKVVMSLDGILNIITHVLE